MHFREAWEQKAHEHEHLSPEHIWYDIYHVDDEDKEMYSDEQSGKLVT